MLKIEKSGTWGENHDYSKKRRPQRVLTRKGKKKGPPEKHGGKREEEDLPGGRGLNG